MSNKIGITERGDAGLDFSWREKIWSKTDGRAILITKNLSAAFCKAVLEETAKGAKLIIHATITGLGGTFIEPNVREPDKNLHNLCALMRAGFPAENLVLRVDPIIPGYEDYAFAVIDKAIALGILPRVPCKISVLDGYKHVHLRFQDAGHPLNFTGFAPPKAVFDEINSRLGYYITMHGVNFTCCAESDLPYATKAGCVGERECGILDVKLPTQGVNPQGRNGCLCLCEVKTELLENKRRCPHQCLYCYWHG